MKSAVQATAATLAILLWTGLAKAEKEFVISPGTLLEVRLTKTLSTLRSKPGSPFKGKIIEAIFVDGNELIPAGTYAEGRVTYLKKPGRVKGVGQMRLHLEKVVLFDGREIPLAAPLEGTEGAPGAKMSDKEGTIKGPSSKTGELITTGAVAATAATVGGLTAGGSGALYGGGLAAGAVGLRSLFKRGKHLLLPQGTELVFVLARPVKLELKEEPEFKGLIIP